MSAADLQAIEQAIAGAAQILVMSHIAPDGDAIGSLTAVGLLLQQLNKPFTLVCDDGVPQRFSYLPLSSTVQSQPDPRCNYDLLIALDAGDPSRLGKGYRLLTEPPAVIINIDHHVTNTYFGHLNYVTSTANSTTEILFDLVEYLPVELTTEMAACLLTGLVTDTLSFRTAGVNAHTLKVAGALVEAGANLFDITTQALNLKDFSTLLLWQKGLNNMRAEEDLVWTTISQEDLQKIGNGSGSTSGLGNLLADTYGTAMSAIFVELADGRVTVGFRCRPPFSVAELAQSLGGGGHHLASGCTLGGPLGKAEARVVQLSKESIRRQKLHHQNGQQKDER